jgi:hypothetical protein
MNRLARISVIISVSVVCFGLAAGYLLWSRHSAAADTTGEPGASGSEAATDLDLDAALGGPHVVFRNAQPGAGFGHLAVSELAQPDGARAVLPQLCERTYATVGRAVCLAPKRGLVPTYARLGLNAGLQPASSSTLAGSPSRTRMSRDGTLVATTTFVAGHSYGDGKFSTETIVRRDGASLGNIENFTTTLPDGSKLTAVDRNFWGVTFAADDDTFYATAASGNTTWLVRGSLSTRTMTALRTDAECPSLSPDGTKIAYKKRLGSKAGVWHLAVLDLQSGKETVLAEQRSVDDQQEWLDNAHVLYALPRAGAETSTDVWQVPADGTGQPSVFIEDASSPAVVRP